MSEISISRERLQYFMHRFAETEHVECGNRSSFYNCDVMKNEGYKWRVFLDFQSRLESLKFVKDDIGSGKLARLVDLFLKGGNDKKDSVNTVNYRNREKHQSELDDYAKSEPILYQLYFGYDDETAFERIIEYFGKDYDYVATLFYLKDCTKYFPCKPTMFDEVFEALGINFHTARSLSWANYNTFLDIIDAVRTELEKYFGIELKPIDAHSFLWIINYKIILPMRTAHQNLPPVGKLEKYRLQETKARIGQKQYRQKLIEYWDGRCSVTGCANTDMLNASHIKPWSQCEKNSEWLDPYNGFLLVPTLDQAFDKGLITFDSQGRIVKSNKLSEDDCKRLGICDTMQIEQGKLIEKHIKYLKYHWKHVFQK